MRPLIVEVPSPLGLRPSGVERAPAALRAAGLHDRLGCDDAQHVAVPAYDDRRDTATGVLNPGGIAEVAFSLALATGRGPRPLTDLDGLAPLVRAEDVVLAGYRVLYDNDRFGTEHVRDSGITVLDYRDLRAGTIPLILDRTLATVTRPGLQGFWVHLDV